MTALTEDTTTSHDTTAAERYPTLEEQVHGLAETVQHAMCERDDAQAALAREQALGIAQRQEILRQAAVIAQLGHAVVEAESQRDAALATAARERAENDRSAARIRRLNERVARQHDTIARLRRDAEPDRFGFGRARQVLQRIGEEIGEEPCACLERPAEPAACAEAPAEPVHAGPCTEPGCRVCVRPAQPIPDRSGIGGAFGRLNPLRWSR